MSAEPTTSNGPSISRELAGALRYAGDLKGERVDLPDVYEFYNDSCAQLAADLQFSESFRSLLTMPLEVGANRTATVASLENFAFEVGCDYRRRGSSRWETLNLVAPERISDAEAAGLYRCTFEGEPRQVTFSFDPGEYEFQLRYVSTGFAAQDPDAVALFPATYSAMKKLLTGHKVLPHVGHDEASYQRFETVILRELEFWEPRWRRFCNRQLKREGTRATGFKASRGRRRDPRRYMVEG